MKSFPIVTSLMLCLALDCFAEPGDSLRPAPPGFAYPTLPPAYEGKTLAELGPLRAIELEHQGKKPSLSMMPISNEILRKLIFEWRLAHPDSVSMLAGTAEKYVTVAFEDGTEFTFESTTFPTITPPKGKPIQCVLLPPKNYNAGRMALPVKKEGEQTTEAD